MTTAIINDQHAFSVAEENLLALVEDVMRETGIFVTSNVTVSGEKFIVRISGIDIAFGEQDTVADVKARVRRELENLATTGRKCSVCGKSIGRNPGFNVCAECFNAGP